MINRIAIACLLAVAAAAQNARVDLGTTSDLTWQPAGAARYVASWGAAWSPLDLAPVAWWTGDATTNDASGTGYALAWQGTPIYTNGVNGQAFGLTGSTWLDAQTTNILGCNLYAAAGLRWSVACWARSAAAGTIIARAGTTAAQRTLHCVVPQGGDYVNVRGTTTASALDARDGAWRHYAMTWDGSTLTCYTNGAAFSTPSVGAAAEELAQRIGIGARSNGGGFFLTGAIDDAMLFTNALDSADVLRLYEWRQ